MLTAPAAPPNTAVTFDEYAAYLAMGVDGIWATTLGGVRMLVGVETYRLAAATFRAGADGDVTAASYLGREGGGFMGSARMPATTNSGKQQEALLVRLGMAGMRVAVCPVWGELSITDIYTDSASGQQHLSLHYLVGDVAAVHADAYQRIKIRLAA